MKYASMAPWASVAATVQAAQAKVAAPDLGKSYVEPGATTDDWDASSSAAAAAAGTDAG